MQFSVANIFKEDREHFLKSIWDQEIHVVKNPEICKWLIERIRLSTIEDVLKRYQGPAMAIGAPVRRLTDDIFDRVLVGRERALQLYREGCSLELDGAHDSFPMVEAPLAQLAADLTLPNSTHSKAIIYLSQKWTGFPPHFDGYTNIIFQLTGNKTWRVAKNDSIERPTVHLELSELPYLPNDIAASWKGSSENMNIEFKEISLKAGEILFLPRGAWHATEAAEESISLNFTYSVPTLADLAAREFRQQLLENPRFRALALGLNQDAKSSWDVAQMVQASYRQRLWDFQ